MRHMQAISATLTALVLAVSAQAEIYKTVDQNGNVVYTDQAPAGGEQVEIKPANSMPAITRPAPDEAAAEDDSEKPVRYKRLKIVSPADDSAIEHGPGDFTVQISSKPALADGHRVQLYLDGKPYGKAKAATSFALKNVHRGTHVLQVRIIDAKGKTLKKSKSSSVHVFRPSVLLPGYRG